MKTLSLFEEFADNSVVQSNTELANPWALDCNGNPVLPENAERHGNYICPKCHEPLKVRKRGKGEHSRRDHFCHKADTACKGYTPHETESYIHKTAKKGIFSIIQSCIDKQEHFLISWTCPTCGKLFNGNLLYHAKSVQIEKQFEDKAEGQDHKQPDVSLIDENGKLIVAIEIVYTHDIEPDTWEFYNKNNIVVLRLKFETVEELKILQHKLQNPDSVNVCNNITCKECQTMHQPRRLTLHHDNAGHQFFVVNIHNPFDDIAIQGVPFNDDEINQANSIVKQNSQLYSVEHRHKEQGFHFALIMQQVAQRHQIRRNHLTIDEMEASGYYGQRKYNKGNYKAKSSSTYGKRGSGVKRSGGKRRK